MRTSSRVTGYALCTLLVLVALLSYATLREDRHGLLTISFLDIGQGDSIFIDAPSGRQVLIDGGRGSLVLQRLAAVMPWWDRSIDLVVATHPDADHIGGLIDVLARYRVGMIMHSSVEGDTQIAVALEHSIEAEGAQEITALRGQVIALGDGAYIEVLYPDRAVPHVATNDGSIVARLVYGDTAFMLTGDAPATVENYLAALDPASLRADVLKAGHHGSKYSSGPIFLGTVGAHFGVFSRGCGNSYGHPAPEVVARFASFGIPTLDTCTAGTVTFVSDGTTVAQK
ncbi:MAG TPA: MBL fold metallo-hydrolase [Candidatus Paceibacterota bacterium]|nr:MBL fold metallo-hydrolase [Candidatus Paceibacterota bacterium]